MGGDHDAGLSGTGPAGSGPPGPGEQQHSAPRPLSAELAAALERAESALRLVVTDIESTTSIREPASIVLYGDWVRATTQGLPPVDLDLQEEEDRLVLAARFGENSRSLEGAESVAELAADIAWWVQDDVIDELRTAWPACPQHEHPLFPEAVAGVAVWICPVNPSSTVPIGQLGSLTRAVSLSCDSSSSLPRPGPPPSSSSSEDRVSTTGPHEPVEDQ